MDEPKKVESPKETRYEFRGKCFSCNEICHVKRDCTNKSFIHVTNFYCHNYHGVGHKEIDCKKPKYDNDKGNNRMYGSLLTLQIEDLMREHQEKEDLRKKGSRSCVISVTTLDT